MRWIVVFLGLGLAAMTLAADKGCTEESSNEVSPPGPTGEQAKAKKPAETKGKDDVRERFPDYRPKTSPDTLLDYRPTIGEQVKALPEARLGSLPELISQLVEYQSLAGKNPGKHEEGNVILGADEKQYVPSDEELLVSELGRRIEDVVRSATRRDLERLGIKPGRIEYRAFSFRHVDVMGSGRFFYASEPEARIIGLAKP